MLSCNFIWLYRLTQQSHKSTNLTVVHVHMSKKGISDHLHCLTGMTSALLRLHFGFTVQKAWLDLQELLCQSSAQTWVLSQCYMGATSTLYSQACWHSAYWGRHSSAAKNTRTNPGFITYFVVQWHCHQLIWALTKLKINFGPSTQDYSVQQ